MRGTGGPLSGTWSGHRPCVCLPQVKRATMDPHLHRRREGRSFRVVYTSTYKYLTLTASHYSHRLSFELPTSQCYFSARPACDVVPRLPGANTVLFSLPWQCRMCLRQPGMGLPTRARAAHSPGILCRAVPHRGPQPTGSGRCMAIGLRGSPTCTPGPTANGGLHIYVAVGQPRSNQPFLP